MTRPKHAATKILRFVIVFLAFAFITMLLALFSVDFIQQFSNMKVRNLIFEICFFGLSLLSFIMHSNMLLRHKEVITYFQDFKKKLGHTNTMSVLPTPQHEAGSKKYLILTYSLYLSCMLIFIVIDAKKVIKLFSTFNWSGDFKDFISTLQFIIQVLQSFGETYASFFTGLADIIPIFIYYHSAMAIEILLNQWESVSNLMLQRGQEDDQQLTEIQLAASSVFEKETRRMSRLYDSIAHLVFRANYLFGHVVILSNGLSIFAICGFVPILLKNPLNEHPFLPYIFTVFLFRLIWPILMSSKLYTSVARLRASVLSFQSRADLNSFSLPEEKAVNALLMQLQEDKLVASPMGLYTITPSILLHVLSIVVTYIIILLQTND